MSRQAQTFRRDPQSSRIILTAKGGETSTPLSCSVDIGRAIYQAEAHKGVGGTGTAACSGDLLLGPLAACAQLTCQLVAKAMGIQTRDIEVTVNGDMDLQGTLGISKEVLAGFEAIRVQFSIDAPQATPDQMRLLQEKTEQYCVVPADLVAPAENRFSVDRRHFASCRMTQVRFDRLRKGFEKIVSLAGF